MITSKYFAKKRIPGALNIARFLLLVGLVTTPSLLWASSTVKGGQIILYSYGPGRVQVTGPDGSRMGADLVTGELLKEIAGSDVALERARDRSDGWTITLKNASPGIYRMDILGTGKGRVVVDLEARDSAGRISRSHVLRRVEAGDTHSYALNFSTAPGSVNELEELPE